MKKIIHIITSLDSGGAQNMLYKLLKYSDKTQFSHEVVSLKDRGVYGEKLNELGVVVHSLNLSKINIFLPIIKLRKICKEFDVIDTWLYHADIIGFLIGKILLKKKLIWNIRHSNLDKEANKSTTLIITRINSLLSKLVNCITYNSNKAFETHKKLGYSNKFSLIVPNGFELDEFKFDLRNRTTMRKELSLSEDEKIIITVGRWSIQKDYYTLLKALNELKIQNIKFKMIMIGTDLDCSNTELMNLIYQYNLKDNILLLGRRSDIPRLLSSADIYVSSSLGESFSNAIGEAMACELVCIVSDVGDSKVIVGNNEFVVEPKNYLQLSEKMLAIIYDSNYREIGKKARSRVVQNYDIKEIIKLYEKTWPIVK